MKAIINCTFLFFLDISFQILSFKFFNYNYLFCIYISFSKRVRRDFENIDFKRINRNLSNLSYTYRDEEGAKSFNSHSSWPGQQGGRRLQTSGSSARTDP